MIAVGCLAHFWQAFGTAALALVIWPSPLLASLLSSEQSTSTPAEFLHCPNALKGQELLSAYQAYVQQGPPHPAPEDLKQRLSEATAPQLLLLVKPYVSSALTQLKYGTGAPPSMVNFAEVPVDQLWISHPLVAAWVQPPHDLAVATLEQLREAATHLMATDPQPDLCEWKAVHPALEDINIRTDAWRILETVQSLLVDDLIKIAVVHNLPQQFSRIVAFLRTKRARAHAQQIAAAWSIVLNLSGPWPTNMAAVTRWCLATVQNLPAAKPDDQTGLSDREQDCRKRLGLGQEFSLNSTPPRLFAIPMLP
ncbi:hypothetical protein H4R35_000023 [Dimargaris xerosporica]|nr:hypothetical protein H4R35_000023 [Dimargaris xerosporica]